MPVFATAALLLAFSNVGLTAPAPVFDHVIVISVDGLLAAAGTAVQRAQQSGMNLVVGYDD